MSDAKSNDIKLYFESNGNQPPIEVIDYLGNHIFYSTDQNKTDRVLCYHVSLYIYRDYI